MRLRHGNKGASRTIFEYRKKRGFISTWFYLWFYEVLYDPYGRLTLRKRPRRPDVAMSPTSVMQDGRADRPKCPEMTATRVAHRGGLATPQTDRRHSRSEYTRDPEVAEPHHRAGHRTICGGVTTKHTQTQGSETSAWHKPHPSGIVRGLDRRCPGDGSVLPLAWSETRPM